MTYRQLTSVILFSLLSLSASGQSPNNVLAQLGVKGVTDNVGTNPALYAGYLIKTGTNGLFNISVFPIGIQPVAANKLLYIDSVKGQDTTNVPGSVTAPYKTLGYAISNAADGYTIVMAPGTYAGPTVTNLLVNNLTLMGYNPTGTVVTGTLTFDSAVNNINLELYRCTVNEIKQNQYRHLTVGMYDRAAVLGRIYRQYPTSANSILTVYRDPSTSIGIDISAVNSTNIWTHGSSNIAYYAASTSRWVTAYGVVSSNVANALDQLIKSAMPAGITPGQMAYWNGANWATTGVGTASQVLYGGSLPAFSNMVINWGTNQLPADFIPSTNDTYNIGQTTNRWKVGYFGKLDVTNGFNLGGGTASNGTFSGMFIGSGTGITDIAYSVTAAGASNITYAGAIKLTYDNISTSIVARPSLFTVGITASESIPGYTWASATANSGWAPLRSLYAACTFNNKIWMSGGGSLGTLLNDVWYTADMTNWVQATAVANWDTRDYFSMIEFNNQLWIIGGYIIGNKHTNDVWHSADGITWDEAVVSAPFVKRDEYGVLVFNNQLWVFGGHTDSGDFTNDVWYSGDGTNWTLATAAANWPVGASFGCTVFNNKMWKMGGWSPDWDFTNSVWSTVDGTNWVLATATAAWGKRAYFGCASDTNGLWVFGGSEIVDTTNDVWYSANGSTWSVITNAAGWFIRDEFQAVSFNSNMIILGGHKGGVGYTNDVWYSLSTAVSASGSFSMQAQADGSVKILAPVHLGTVSGPPGSTTLDMGFSRITNSVGLGDHWGHKIMMWSDGQFKLAPYGSADDNTDNPYIFKVDGGGISVYTNFTFYDATRIFGLQSPVASDEPMTKGYTEANYLPLAGGKMTGPITNATGLSVFQSAGGTPAVTWGPYNLLVARMNNGSLTLDNSFGNGVFVAESDATIDISYSFGNVYALRPLSANVIDLGSTFGCFAGVEMNNGGRLYMHGSQGALTLGEINYGTVTNVSNGSIALHRSASAGQHQNISGGGSIGLFGRTSSIESGAYQDISGHSSIGAGTVSVSNNQCAVFGDNGVSRGDGSVMAMGGFFTGSNIVPIASNKYDLGTAAFPFRDLYLDTNSVYMGGQKVLSYDPSTTNLIATVPIIQQTSPTNTNTTAYTTLAIYDAGTNSVLGQSKAYTDLLSNDLARLAVGSEGIRLIGALGGYTLDTFLKDVLSRGPARDRPVFAYTIGWVPAPSLVVTWSTGDVYDPTYGYQHLTAGTNPLTDNAINYAYWGTNSPLVVQWTTGTRPDASTTIFLGEFSTAFGGIINARSEFAAGDLPLQTADGNSAVLPSLITSGMNVYPSGTALSNILAAAGIEYQDMVRKNSHLPQNLADTNVTLGMLAFAHTNAGLWGYALTNALPVGYWDNGTNIVACNAADWYRGVFVSIAGMPMMNWIYPQTEYTNYDSAAAADDPVLPSGFDPYTPKTTAYVFKGDDTTLRQETTYWLDRRFMIRRGTINSGGGSGTTPTLQQVLTAGHSTGGILPDGAGMPTTADQLTSKQYVDSTINNINANRAYVDPMSGNDSTAQLASSIKPFKTIQKAIDTAAVTLNRYVVTLSPGSYTENISMSNGVSILGSDIEATIINGTITYPIAYTDQTGAEIQLVTISTTNTPALIINTGDDASYSGVRSCYLRSTYDNDASNKSVVVIYRGICEIYGTTYNELDVAPTNGFEGSRNIQVYEHITDPLNPGLSQLFSYGSSCIINSQDENDDTSIFLTHKNTDTNNLNTLLGGNCRIYMNTPGLSYSNTIKLAHNKTAVGNTRIKDTAIFIYMTTTNTCTTLCAYSSAGVYPGSVTVFRDNGVNIMSGATSNVYWGAATTTNDSIIVLNSPVFGGLNTYPTIYTNKGSAGAYAINTPAGNGDMLLGGAIDMSGVNTLANVANPVSGHGKIVVDTSSGLEQPYFIDSTGLKFRMNRDITLAGYNAETNTLNVGELIYIAAGVYSGSHYVKRAKADSVTTLPCLGIVVNVGGIAASTRGRILRLGRIESGIDTSMWSAGDKLYVSPTVAGGITNVEPANPYISQLIGWCNTSSTNGSLTIWSYKPDTLGNQIPSAYALNASLPTNNWNSAYTYTTNDPFQDTNTFNTLMALQPTNNWNSAYTYTTNDPFQDTNTFNTLMALQPTGNWNTAYAGTVNNTSIWNYASAPSRFKAGLATNISVATTLQIFAMTNTSMIANGGRYDTTNARWYPGVTNKVIELRGCIDFPASINGQTHFLYLYKNGTNYSLLNEWRSPNAAAPWNVMWSYVDVVNTGTNDYYQVYIDTPNTVTTGGAGSNNWWHGVARQ